MYKHNLIVKYERFYGDGEGVYREYSYILDNLHQVYGVMRSFREDEKRNNIFNVFFELLPVDSDTINGPLISIDYDGRGRM